MLDEGLDLPPLPDTAEPGSKEYDIIQWAEERLRRGIHFVESSVGYDKIDKALSEVFSNERSSSVSYAPGAASRLSQTRVNLVAKTAEDLTAMLTDTRYFWDYSTENAKYQPQTRLANKSAERWYSNRQIALRIGDVIRYYTVAGTGYLHLSYSRRLSDMIAEAKDPRCVFPIDPISSHSLQDCTGVIIRDARTPEWFLAEYGKNVAAETDVGALAKTFSWLTKLVTGPGERNGPLDKRSRGDRAIPFTPTVFVNTLYLTDNRVNKSSSPVYMGKWSDAKGVERGKPGCDESTLSESSPWSYLVQPGAPLYPFKRLIVWANGVLGYDGPSPYWHGQFPIIKLTLNPWPGSWLGKAPLWDCLPLSHSINQNLRVIDDHNQQVAQPAVIADRNVAKSELQKFDSRAAGAKIRTNTASGKGIVVQPPPALENIIFQTIDRCETWMAKISGVADPSSMASLAQIPSDDTIDTLMKAMTPSVRLRSRILEAFYTEFAQQYLFCFAEFDSLQKRLAEFGPMGATAEDFDFSPGTFVPDDVPDGDPGDIASTENAFSDLPRPLYSRAKSMLASIQCKFDPSSLLNTAAQQDLMKYFLLAKMGYISVFTIWDKMGIMNTVGPEINLPADEIGRLKLQQAMGIGMIANAQGRKATDAAPPSMGQTANGPTIQTS